MRRKRLLTIIGSVCLALMLALPLVASCGPATPEAAEEEIAALESKLAAEKAKTQAAEGEISDLEAEIAELKAPAEVFELKFSSIFTRGGFYFVLYEEFTRNIEKMSGGRIEVEVYGAGELATAGEEFETVRVGLLDIGMVCPAYYTGVVPSGDIEAAVLGGLRHQVEVEILYWERGWVDILREVYAPFDLYYLGPSIYPVGYRVTSRYPITSLEDFKGLKVRAIPPSSILLSKLGASVVFVPWGELYMAIATGVIDAAVYGDFPSTRELKMHEFAPYHLDPPLASTSSNAFVVNMDTWNRLPEDVQHILQVACWENGGYTGIVVLDTVLEAWMEIQAEGAELTHMSQEDAKTLLLIQMEMLNELGAVNPTMGKMIEIYKDLMTELGYL